MKTLISLVLFVFSSSVFALDITPEFCGSDTGKKAIYAAERGLDLGKHQDLVDEIYATCGSFKYESNNPQAQNQKRIDYYKEMSKFDRVFAWDREQQSRKNEIPSRSDVAMVEIIFGIDSIEYSVVETRFENGIKFGENVNILTIQ